MAPLTASNETPASLTLFLGHGNLARDFTASLAAEQPPTQWRLVIVPKKPDPNAISMVLIVDRATLKLVGLEKRDSQDGTNTFTFSNLKENVGLADKEFNKTFPAGTKYDIIR
jgi:outer membrane lipoprotein-sorting protein